MNTKFENNLVYHNPLWFRPVPHVENLIGSGLELGNKLGYFCTGYSNYTFWKILNAFVSLVSKILILKVIYFYTGGMRCTLNLTRKVSRKVSQTYTRDFLQREARASETSLQRVQEGSPPYPTCSYALLCALYNARSQSVTEAMWIIYLHS